MHLCGVVFEIRLETSTTTVRASGGSPTALVEVGEVLIWLGAACRSGPELDRPSYCSTLLSFDGSPSVCSASYSFSSVPMSAGDHGGSDSCWHSLFRNPTIAKGYPVTARPSKEQGLEISLPMMISLGQSPFTAVFSGTTVLKGFHTAFAPMIKSGSSTVWHFLVNQDHRRLSYCSILAAARAHGEMDHCSLETGRHFVGWTPSADICTGKYYNRQSSDSCCDST